ncbi:unnamed protein product [Parnassius apollo]|uniref:(apollo) hypothetical protein n=1 Tax=Parnassius apollo TaxID=110799 RepID=A0A8S3Y5V5_PARAO|nr:unnamed protein product [Parnassius apollo]
MADKEQLSALEVGELDLFVDSMEPTQIENIGNQAWIEWHIRLQKLNQQAVLEASSMVEELTKETLISHGKLYHEAAAVGLLETVLFHEDGVQSISDVVIDLLQYAVDQLTALIVLINDGYFKPVSVKEMDCETVVEELQRQKRDLQFDISMRCISIVRIAFSSYLAEHMEAAGLGASIAINLYKSNDVPSIVCQLIQMEPWKKLNENGELQIFKFGRWSRPNSEDLSHMHRGEAQLWLCLRQLLLEPRLEHYYKIEECRRTSFCRLQAKISDDMIDEIPVLGELKTLLCQMALGDYSYGNNRYNGAKNPGCAAIEVIPQIKENLLRQIHKRVKKLAKMHLNHCCNDETGESHGIAKKLLDSYASDVVLALDNGGVKCAECGDKASKKCSRCKTEWYCGRECQVQHWPKHKKICDQFEKLNKTE